MVPFQGHFFFLGRKYKTILSNFQRYLEPMMVKNHCLLLLSHRVSTSPSCTWLFGSPYLFSSHTWEEEEEWDDLIKSWGTSCTPHKSSHFCPHLTTSRLPPPHYVQGKFCWECGSGSLWGLCLERRRRQSAPWGWSKQTVYARRKSRPLLRMPQRRKEGRKMLYLILWL